MTTTVKERLAILETKINNLQKNMWILTVACIGQFGIEFIPLFPLPLA